MIVMKDGKMVSDGVQLVKIRDLTELAVRNLRESLLRNSLTTLGIRGGRRVARRDAVARRGIAGIWRASGSRGRACSMRLWFRRAQISGDSAAPRRTVRGTLTPAGPLDEDAQTKSGSTCPK